VFRASFIFEWSVSVRIIRMPGRFSSHSFLARIVFPVLVIIASVSRHFSLLARKYKLPPGDCCATETVFCRGLMGKGLALTNVRGTFYATKNSIENPER
jgi:hypothetical protein